MGPDRILRAALWTTAVLNVAVGCVFAFPESALGRVAGLPPSVPALYRLALAWTIALFGLGYGWLATLAAVPRPLVVGAILGKGGFALLVLVLFLSGDVPARLALLGSGDLAFAGLFAWWLSATRIPGVGEARPSCPQ